MRRDCLYLLLLQYTGFQPCLERFLKTPIEFLAKISMQISVILGLPSRITWTGVVVVVVEAAASAVLTVPSIRLFLVAEDSPTTTPPFKEEHLEEKALATHWKRLVMSGTAVVVSTLSKLRCEKKTCF